MTNPKLALIPSGYKATKVYSILPSDGGGDFTFDRASEGTRVRKDGLIEEVTDDVPRLDWLNSNCPSLLLESQRTNLLTYSQDFSQWANTGSETTDTSNALISPSGLLNATKLQEANSNFGYHRLTKSITASSSTDYSLSFFAKKGTISYVQLLLINTNNSEASSKVFDLENGVIGETILYGGGTLSDAKIEDFGNGWYRCSIVSQLTTTPNTFRINLANAATGNTINLGMVQYTGNSNGNIYIWGAQVEEGNYPTSYIKTEGSTTTRLFDDLESDTSYSTENDVTWFLDFDTYTFENSFRAAMVVRNSGFTQTMDWISYKSGSNYYIRIRATNQSALQTIIDFGEDAIQMFTRNKVAVRLYGSNFEIYVNGTREYTGTSDDGDWTVLNNGAILNDFGTTSERPSTKLYDFRVYDQTMTQSELEELTTL